MKRALNWRDGQFFLHGKPFTIHSGAIHYFRVPRAYWRDRLNKLVECGFNTVETYVAWNVHEPKEGAFDFSGENDVAAFLRTARELGLYAIVRPGPFICAEWEFGGFPSWLLKDRNMRLRCNDPRYMQKVERYFKRLFEELRPCAAENGGNVLLWQVENEYGSFGNDKVYLERLVQIYRENGIDGQLFTADGATPHFVINGSCADCLPFLTFGSDPDRNMPYIDLIDPSAPKMCAEFWCGWFDHWGEAHHTRLAESVTSDLRRFFANGWSFNFYMFHGGTNFGFMNGANGGEKYMPTVTSYDYCGLLTEAGDRTSTYYAIRDLFIQCGVAVPPLTAVETEKAAYGLTPLCERAMLFDSVDALAAPILRSSYLPSMEEAGQDYGYILYETTVRGGIEEHPLYLIGLGDRAIVFLDGVRIATVNRNDPEYTLFDTLKGACKLQILIENRGRINYGREILERKGLEEARYAYSGLYDWTTYSFDMRDLSALRFDAANGTATDMPVFCAGALVIDNEPRDTFVRIQGADRGFITVNGFNLGRFNNGEGPQKTLYVPAPYLKTGENRIVVFCSDGAQADIAAVFDDAPTL